MIRLVATLAVLTLAGAAAAQTGIETAGPSTVCRLPVHAAEAVASRSVERQSGPGCATPTARFAVTYTGFPAQAEAAFQAAVDTWSCQLVASGTIRIDARWEPLEATTLGSAGPYLVRNFPGAPLRETWYPAALANEIAGRDLDTSQPDIEALFNSQFDDWHLDPTRSPPPGQFDLYTVVLHEIGHGLGLIGALTVDNGRGFVGEVSGTRGPYIYDRYTEDASGTALLDASVYPDGSTELAAALQRIVRFDGAAVRQVAGAPVTLYAPPRWDEGASYSHLDEQTYPPGTPDGLMTPFITRGETVAQPGGRTCGLFADLGWRLAGTCADLVGERPDVQNGLTAALAGANPFGRSTRVQVDVLIQQRVRATLLDALGRTVQVLADEVVEAGGALSVEIDGRPLAAGVYRVHVVGEGGEALLPLVHVR